MNDVAWQTEHSVETAADPIFAWQFMSNVANWEDPPALFSLYGAFESGSRGETQMPGQPPRSWQLRNVTPLESYTIEFLLENATMFFEWRFTPLPGGGARLTQRMRVEGQVAAEALTVIQQEFAASLAPGMSRIAALIDRVYAAAR